MASPNSSPALECLLSPQASWQQTFFFFFFFAALPAKRKTLSFINFILMNYALNPSGPRRRCFCPTLCALSGIQSTPPPPDAPPKKKKTFLSESLNSSWVGAKKKTPLLWKLKLNTFLPTTPGCLKECSTFLDPRPPPDPPTPTPALHTGTHPHTFRAASAPERPGFVVPL